MKIFKSGIFNKIGKRKIIILTIFLIFILFLIFIKFIFRSFNFEETNEFKEIGTDQLLTGTKSCVSYKIRFPYFKYKQVDNFISDEIYEEIEDFIEKVKKENGLKNAKSCSIISDYKSYAFDGNCGVSLFVNYFKKYGNKNENDIKTYVFHNGKNIKIEEIIDMDKKNELKEIIKKGIISNKRNLNVIKTCNINLDDKLSAIDNDILRYFGIRDDDFIVYFRPGDILPKKYGVLEVKIYNKFLKDIFTCDYYKINKKIKPPSEKIKDEAKKPYFKDLTYDGGPVIALTFDDGPKEGTTDLLIDVLKNEDVNATFFVIGKNVEEFPDILKKAADLGNEIANHTYNHKTLTRLSEDQIVNEIEKTNDLVEKVTGIRPKLIRPPGGSVKKKLFSTINYPVINWSIDTRDWSIKKEQDTIDKVLKNAEDGDIVLMHDVVPSTVEAAKVIIPKLKEKGFKIVTVSELFKLKNIELEKGKQYFSTNKILDFEKKENKISMDAA